MILHEDLLSLQNAGPGAVFKKLLMDKLRPLQVYTTELNLERFQLILPLKWRFILGTADFELILGLGLTLGDMDRITIQNLVDVSHVELDYSTKHFTKPRYILCSFS